MQQHKQTRKQKRKWPACCLLVAMAFISGCKEDSQALQSLSQQIAGSEKRSQAVEREFQTQIKKFEVQVTTMMEVASAQQLHIDRLKNEIGSLKAVTESLKSDLSKMIAAKAIEDERAKFGASDTLIENICIELTRMLDEPIKFRYGDGFQTVTNESDRLKSFISDRRLKLNKLIAELEGQGYPRWEEIKEEVGKCIFNFGSSISSQSVSVAKAAAGNTNTADHDMVEYYATRKKAGESVPKVRGFKTSGR